MAIEPVPSVAPVPTPLIQRGDRETFSDRVDIFVTWLEGAPVDFKALGDNVLNNANETYTLAGAASTSASAAAGSASAAAVSAGSAATSAAGAATSASNAATSETNAAASAANAAASAASAAALAGAFVGTSSSSVTIGTGNKSFTTQTGELYTPGVFMTAVSQANNANFMFGQVQSYNSGTGALVIAVSVTGGAGTFADWNLSLTGAQGAQGPQGPAGNLSGGQLLGALDELKGVDIASASITNVWGITGNSATLTGTATINSFGTASQAGAKRTLIAASTATLTNGANLIVPGGANYVTAAGDRIEIFAETTTQHRVSIWKADGTPVRSSVPSGVATTSPMTGNITLTASSALWQIVKPNAAGLSVTLPDTLGLLVAGAVNFIVQNDSDAFPVSVKDFAGNIVGWAMPRDRCAMQPRSVSASAAGWLVSNNGGNAESAGAFLHKRGVLFGSLGPTDFGLNSVVMDDTWFVACNRQTAGNITVYSQKLPGVGGRNVTATGGGSIAITAGSGAQQVNVIRISATLLAVFWFDVAANQVRVQQLSLNASTGALANVGALAGIAANFNGAVSAALVDATRILVQYTNASQISAVVIYDVAGAAYGSPVALTGGYGVTQFNVPPLVLSTTIAIAMYSQTNGNNNGVVRLTIAGNVLTKGVDVALSVQVIGMAKNSSSQGTIVYADSTSYNSIGARTVTDNGTTTAVLGTAQNDLLPYSAAGGARVVPVRDGRAAVFTNDQVSGAILGFGDFAVLDSSGANPVVAGAGQLPYSIPQYSTFNVLNQQAMLPMVTANNGTNQVTGARRLGLA